MWLRQGTGCNISPLGRLWHSVAASQPRSMSEIGLCHAEKLPEARTAPETSVKHVNANELHECGWVNSKEACMISQ